MRVEAVYGEAGLLALRPSWESVVRRGGGTSPFQSWATVYHAARLDRFVVAPILLVVYGADGKIVGFLPCGLQTRRDGLVPWRTLTSVGPKRLDFLDLVAVPGHEDDVARACVDWLARHPAQWDELGFDTVRADAHLLAALARLQRPRSLDFDVERVGVNLAIAVPENAKSWEDVLTGETRRTTRRTVRRLQSAGFEACRVSRGFPLEAAVDAFVDLHSRRRRELGHAPRFADVSRRALCDMVAAAVAEGGDLLLLARDGVPAAAQWSLRLRDRVSLYRLGFDSAYRELSPGIGLLAAAVDDAIRTGCREYDFGFGTEEYKRRWANLERPIYRVQIKNRNVRRLPRRALALATKFLRGPHGAESMAK
jgi:CelD/BcsL family acetyltransferase involved in cellulose biosynthesis